MKSRMPWDQLRGETIRQVVKELGFNYQGLRRDEMVEYLQAVEKDGLKAALASQNKRRAVWEVVHPRAKRPRVVVSPLKMATRLDADKQLELEEESIPTRKNKRFTLDCVWIDTPRTRKRKERQTHYSAEGTEFSPGIGTRSLSPDFPPSSSVYVDSTTGRSDEDFLPSFRRSTKGRAAGRLSSPTDGPKGVRTYAKRKVGRPRKSAQF